MGGDRNRKSLKSRTHREQLSREEGTVFKDWGGRLPIALIYPNSYYLGMSNLGIHVIYALLNSYGKTVCERIFWENGSSSKRLLSLESQRPLSDFAVLAFSVSYELDYFNVVQILRASGIPLYAAERDERHPLIIAGGPCITANPMPLAPFFDCLCIGEAEPIIPSMLPVLSEKISGHRDELLQALASLPGIYVPQQHYKKPVTRQWANNLDSFPAISSIITPDTELGDLYLIELERGCSWGCRFCLVHTTYSPMRFLSAEKVIEASRQGLQYRKRIGLVGPAISDHPQIEAILDSLLELRAEISVSSLRVSHRSIKILSSLTQGKIQTATIAPEAGSPRLREVINKGITEDTILEFVSRAAELGIKQLKLYFIIGLPSETDEDVEGIARLTMAIKDIIEKQKSGTRIALNVSPFVPKAGTPFQWLPMTPVPVLKQRLSRLNRNLAAKGIKFKYESPDWSQVQGVLSRGDASLAGVLADMEEVSLSGWRRAIEKHQLDIDFYVNQRWETTQKLPWVAIDSGSKTEKLEQELEKALATEL